MKTFEEVLTSISPHFYTSGHASETSRHIIATTPFDHVENEINLFEPRFWSIKSHGSTNPIQRKAERTHPQLRFHRLSYGLRSSERPAVWKTHRPYTHGSAVWKTPEHGFGSAVWKKTTLEQPPSTFVFINMLLPINLVILRRQSHLTVPTSSSLPHCSPVRSRFSHVSRSPLCNL